MELLSARDRRGFSSLWRRACGCSDCIKWSTATKSCKPLIRSLRKSCTQLQKINEDEEMMRNNLGSNQYSLSNYVLKNVATEWKQLFGAHTHFQNIFIDPIVSARKKAEKRDRHEEREKERERRFGVNAIISHRIMSTCKHVNKIRIQLR